MNIHRVLYEPEPHGVIRVRREGDLAVASAARLYPAHAIFRSPLQTLPDGSVKRIYTLVRAALLR